MCSWSSSKIFSEKNISPERYPEARRRSRVLNLTFHGVGNPWREIRLSEADIWLSVGAYQMVMDVISGRDDIVLTIDDGNSSDVEIILPSLLEHGMKASFFVCPGNFDRPGYLTAKNVRDLSQAGMIVGSHGMYHRDWRHLKDEELYEDLSVSKELLEQEIGQSVTQAACPKGSYDRRVLRFLRRAGYRRVYTSDTGFSWAEDWLQARTTIHSNINPDLLRQIVEQHPWSTKEFIRIIKGCIKRWR